MDRSGLASPHFNHGRFYYQHARDSAALLQDMTLEASCTVETRDCRHIGEIQQRLAENGVKLYGGQWPAALS
jgi:hypothetical protein